MPVRPLCITPGPFQLQLARVQMMVGSKDKAVELLKPLVEVPNNI